MRNTREILRQKWLLKRTHRAICASVGVSVGAVSLALQRAADAQLTWEAVVGLDDAQLEARLYPSVVAAGSRPEPDCAWIHRERHRPGVTLDLLHHEYLEKHPGGLRYTTFCDRYREWLGRRGLVMRQVHVAGDKAFVDYSGKKPSIVDPHTGEVTEVELFVAVLGASNLTYAEATLTQRGPDWIASHVRAFEYFGGVPAALVPDQLKSGVTRACRYEPDVQRTYEELAQHYGTTVLPARPAHPRDKAKVEVGVQIAQRWLLARIRDEVFHSVGELNARLRELLVDLNGREMRRYGMSKLSDPCIDGLPRRGFFHPADPRDALHGDRPTLGAEAQEEHAPPRRGQSLESLVDGPRERCRPDPKRPHALGEGKEVFQPRPAELQPEARRGQRAKLAEPADAALTQRMTQSARHRDVVDRNVAHALRNLEREARRLDDARESQQAVERTHRFVLRPRAPVHFQVREPVEIADACPAVAAHGLQQGQRHRQRLEQDGAGVLLDGDSLVTELRERRHVRDEPFAQRVGHEPRELLQERVGPRLGDGGGRKCLDCREHAVQLAQLGASEARKTCDVSHGPAVEIAQSAQLFPLQGAAKEVRER
jgi:transposase